MHEIGREIGLDLTVLQNSPTELERLLTLVQTEIALYRSISKPEQNLRQDAVSLEWASRIIK